VRIEPGGPLAGRVTVPGDKSISHRTVLIASICEGKTRIAGYGRNADTEATIAAVRALGVRVDELVADTLRIHGVGLHGLVEPAGAIDCANAGTLMRLLAGILADQGGSFELVGDASLSVRPMERIAEPLRRMGARVETTDGHAPLRIEGGALSAISYKLPVASAQVKSAVLLAGLLARDSETTVVERVPTRDHTESLLEMAGAYVLRRADAVTVWPAERLELGDLDVPGDFSAAAPFIVAATLMEDSELHVHGVNLNPRRTGLLGILERMGADVAVRNPRRICGEPAGDLVVRHATLQCTEVGGAEVPRRSTSSRCSRSRRRARPGRASSAGPRSYERRRATGSTRSSRACTRWERTSRRRPTASACAVARAACGAGRWRVVAITGSPWSQPSQRSSRSRESRSATPVRCR